MIANLEGCDAKEPRKFASIWALPAFAPGNFEYRTNEILNFVYCYSTNEIALEVFEVFTKKRVELVFVHFAPIVLLLMQRNELAISF